MYKKIAIFISPFIFFIILFILLIIYNILLFNYKLEIDSIKKLNFDTNTNELTIEITKKENIYNDDFLCTIFNNNIKITEKSKDNKCTLKFVIGSNYYIILENEYNKSNRYNILDFFDNVLEIDSNYENIYLAVGEAKELNYTSKTINGENTQFENNSDIITITDDIITAKKAGKTIIYNGEANINVIVTDLVSLPMISNDKTTIPCNKYSEEENNILDNILKYKISEAGLGTRAGVVAAARFLTLQFPYKLPYFFENGRLNNINRNYVDGEGRYYHNGLYLNEYKFQNIVASYKGPSIWGCPLTNLEDDKDFGFIPGIKMPNGLDCSGFVSWAIYNGGYDVGDLGAYDLARLGDLTTITQSIINSNKIKNGDLLHYNGHIAIIIGIDEKNYYVAESLQNYKGLVVNTYKKEKITNVFTHVTLMDNYYKEDGNYSEYW